MIRIVCKLIVAISGNTVVVGARYDSIGSNYGQGSAYIFVRQQFEKSLPAYLGRGLTLNTRISVFPRPSASLRIPSRRKNPSTVLEVCPEIIAYLRGEFGDCHRIPRRN